VLPHASFPLTDDDDLWTRTLRLAERVGDDGSQGRTLYFWSAYRWYVGNYREALVLAEKCCALANKRDSSDLRVMGSLVRGTALHFLGDHKGALNDIGFIVDYTANQGALHGYRMTGSLTLANILWLQGFPDQAIKCAEMALVEVPGANSPLLAANILARAACPIALYVGNLAEAERAIAMLLDWTAKGGLNAWNAVGRSFKGSLLLTQGDRAGLLTLRSALDWLNETRFAFHYTMSLASLAQGLGAAGRLAEAHLTIDEAIESVKNHEEHWCMPEILRIKGELIRLDGSTKADETAENYFQQALDWARRQEALSWELRAAMSLARLRRDNGKVAEAAELLSAVYDRFTEGFDTVDLRTARALMDEFRQPST
jgi:tetratricopeptide (TPR) repeat protein